MRCWWTWVHQSWSQASCMTSHLWICFLYSSLISWFKNDIYILIKIEITMMINHFTWLTFIKMYNLVIECQRSAKTIQYYQSNIVPPVFYDIVIGISKHCAIVQSNILRHCNRYIPAVYTSAKQHFTMVVHNEKTTKWHVHSKSPFIKLLDV